MKPHFLSIKGKQVGVVATVLLTVVALVFSFGFVTIAGYKLMMGDAQTAIVAFLIQVLIWLIASRFVRP